MGLSMVLLFCSECIFLQVNNDIFQIDMSKVNLDTMKPWITSRITDLLGFEDDVVIEFIFNQLEDRVSRLLLFFHLHYSFINAMNSLFL